MILYSAFMYLRRGSGTGLSFEEALPRRTRRSQLGFSRTFLSRIEGWITMCRGRDATMTLTDGDCLSRWWKDCGLIDGSREKRCRVRRGIL